MRWTRLAIACGLLSLAAAAPAARAQVPPDLLSYGIVGVESGDYFAVMSRVEVQKLLLDVAAAPRRAEFLDGALQGTGVTRQRLEGLGLVRRHGEEYVLSFTLLTASDVPRIRKVSDGYARSLAAELLARRPELDAALAPYQATGVDRRAVAYILLGCFSLDWDGLAVTAEKGYRTVASLRPNGDRYVPTAEQKTAQTLQGIYWGSHSMREEEAVFTSFGDHFSLPRQAFPDLVWHLPGRPAKGPPLPEPLAAALGRVVQTAMKPATRQAGRMMLALRDGGRSADELAMAAGITLEEAKPLLDLLVELQYVERGEGASGRYVARIPVFDERDKAMIQRVVAIGRRVMTGWLAANYERIKADLADLTPLRFGVPFGEGFTEIWHYIFGAANRHLVEAGLFADPYASERSYKGFIPVVYSATAALAPDLP
jgi:hypothetical protein